MTEAIDMALDDLVKARGRGRGGGRGKGGSSKGGLKGAKAWLKRKAQPDGEKKGGRGKGKARASSEPPPAKGDAAKLDMSLDEVIEKSSSKGKGKGAKDRDSEGKGKGRGGGKGKSDWKDSGKSGGSWWSDEGSYGKGKYGGYDKENKGNDKGSWNSSWNSKGSKGSKKGASSWKGGDDDRDRGGDYKPQWNEHDDRAGDDFGGKGDSKGSRKGRKGGWDDWEDGRKGGKGDRWSSWGGGGKDSRKGDDVYESRGAGAPRAWSDNDRRDDDGWQRVAQTRDRDERPIRDAAREERGRMARDVGRAGKAVREPALPQKRPREEMADTRTAKAVKVTNIPRDVNVQDIREAFEAETGKITRCRLDGGTAWIAFTKAQDARKAVDTFDRGELNGNTIGVVLDP